jgi:hypothetical protein
MLKLGVKDSQLFIAELLSNSPPSEKLIMAAKKYKEWLAQNYSTVKIESNKTP